MADVMQRLVAAVVAESRPGGEVRRVYQRVAGWEGPMRRGFGQLRVALATGSPAAPDLALERLGYLNGRYGTRHPKQQLPEFARLTLAAIDELGWWRSAPPRLFGSDDTQAEQIARAVPVILGRVALADGRRGYSLVTKFLHFCLPETFPIFDSQATASMQACSYLVPDQRGQGWTPFRLNLVRDTWGHGYRTVVAFYRAFWRAATPPQRADLEALAEGCALVAGGPVSPLDLLDKLLWTAQGDPVRLGLHRVQQPQTVGLLAVGLP